MLYRNALEACQRHAATIRAGNHTKPEFCNTPPRDYLTVIAEPAEWAVIAGAY